jgi:hypothetical protein
MRRLIEMFVPTLAPPRPRFAETPFGFNSERLYDEAETMWLVHNRRARWWTRLHYVLGLATTILAATAGFGGLGDLFGKVTAAYVALAAAVAAAVATFLRTDEQRKQHEALAAGWDNLRDDVVTIYSTAVGYVVGPQRHTRRLASDRTRDASSWKPPPDPYGWEVVVGELQSRAKVLRTGQLDTGNTPAWPKPPHKRRTQDRADQGSVERSTDERS